jgi:LAS superfamily LD-carboxypeptidase LdcB
MSIESVLGRIAEIQGTTAPAAAPAQAAPATQFSNVLQSAMAPTAGTAPTQAAPGTYPHLSGDLDANPELLQRLETLATQRGEHFTITSGGRSFAEQQRLWDARGSNPYPVARPGTSRHETGRAADVMIGGRAIQDVISAAELRRAGLSPLAGDAVHVELP